MTASAISAPVHTLDDREYKRRIWAWTMYDWANSAFATTILAAVLPIYYSQVAGSTLPSAATATAYWSAGLSLSLLIAAIISPILGTVSDIMRNKKPLLAVFAGIGILATALLVFVESGDWILASMLGIVGRIGFNGANVFYDALLPHIAKKEDQDRVSTRGYAMGYLGGGLLLAINIVMIQLLPGTLGARLSFLSVAIWWTVFTIPLMRMVPEPHTESVPRRSRESVLGTTFRRMGETLRELSRYKQLFLYLIAFLIYVDGIGTIIGVAAIYGAELGFSSVELILALLLVQFVGIPYSLIFGRLPSRQEKRRPFFLAFVLFNLLALPLVGVLGARLLPTSLTGLPPAPYSSSGEAVGQGAYLAGEPALDFNGSWTAQQVSAEQLGGEAAALYQTSQQAGDNLSFVFNGQDVVLTYATGPEHSIWAVEIDGELVLDESGDPVVIDAYSPTERYDEQADFSAPAPGVHTLTVTNMGEKNLESTGTDMVIGGVEVLPPARASNLGAIVGLILAVEAVGLLLALLLGPVLFRRAVEAIDTKRAILLALMVYAVIAVWGYFLNSVIEFWFLAWMVAVVQGGSQALSRSLFSAMSPASKSGEFFGLFGIMEKFSAILGPLIFAFAATTFGNSRPAVLSVVVFFVVGGLLLSKVNVKEGMRVAQEEDAAAA